MLHWLAAVGCPENAYVNGMLDAPTSGWPSAPNDSSTLSCCYDGVQVARECVENYGTTTVRTGA